ncbi:hypothetical protein Z517_07450 [Fonsecaea pedrosoi CBS 271.37]|uniref:FAD/NAD(P)-binding domain-containing protein n=1 Tax=Fonsecaea pedrosoi CBS 271.37 TaxID=1442368 RepID=A0A0D2GJ25_9EURO|nr:uncharacterized protein Z517_07450 [Fonsecaea pedrosoi CBS 271.37]KIW80833.1 hypothetical protein Z517_07450 [Fonsecaea pedrosoi CBS 271.37]
MSAKLTDYDAIVVAAGFGGIRTLLELVQTSLTVKCFEAGSNVGGACMNFAPELKEEWNYRERYPSQDDVKRYLGHITDHFDLRKKIEFDTRIASAHYSDSQKTWTITITVASSTTYRYFRTLNYVLPGRKYTFNEYQKAAIKQNYNTTWNRIRQILDSSWQSGGFHFQFETFNDLITDIRSNEIASEYLRKKIRAIIKELETVEALYPKYPFLSKRPPCGHFYYETFNRSNVKLVDVSRDDINVFENGIRLGSGVEYEFNMIIFALGFDAATGALSEFEVKGTGGKVLKDYWERRLETFAGALVPGFPNIFIVCGPYVPFGNMPVV